MGRLTTVPYICLLFSGFPNVYHFTYVWPTALKLSCITDFYMLFLVMGVIPYMVNITYFSFISVESDPMDIAEDEV